jgi:hypothetical protein
MDLGLPSWEPEVCGMCRLVKECCYFLRYFGDSTTMLTCADCWYRHPPFYPNGVSYQTSFLHITKSTDYPQDHE